MGRRKKRDAAQRAPDHPAEVEPPRAVPAWVIASVLAIPLALVLIFGQLTTGLQRGSIRSGAGSAALDRSL